MPGESINHAVTVPLVAEGMAPKAPSFSGAGVSSPAPLTPRLGLRFFVRLLGLVRRLVHQWRAARLQPFHDRHDVFISGHGQAQRARLAHDRAVEGIDLHESPRHLRVRSLSL